MFSKLVFVALALSGSSPSPMTASAACLPCRFPISKRAALESHLSVPLVARASYTPAVTNPTNTTIWAEGTDVFVRWNTTGMPKSVESQRGTLLLGQRDAGGSEERIDLDHPLATEFELKSGFINFKCPKVDVKKQFFVVLFADSGNRSPMFTIRK